MEWKPPRGGGGGMMSREEVAGHGWELWEVAGDGILREGVARAGDGGVVGRGYHGGGRWAIMGELVALTWAGGREVESTSNNTSTGVWGCVEGGVVRGKHCKGPTSLGGMTGLVASTDIFYLHISSGAELINAILRLYWGIIIWGIRSTGDWG